MRILCFTKKHGLVLFLLLVLILLRFVNLGYSEYIPDESTVLHELRENGFYTWEFLLNQPKGPLQFLVANLVFFFNQNVYNEFIFRLPFAIASIFSVLIFYKFLNNVVKNKNAAFFGALLFGVNGFIVAFGRLLQYQSLNLLFSALTLYFYSLVLSRTKVLRNTLFGTASFCLSLLSHWDAIYVLPFVFYVLFNVFRDLSVQNSLRKELIVTNILVLIIILAPFFVPYSPNFLSSEHNQIYFTGRTGFDSQNFNLGHKLNDYKFRIELYNPFVLSVLLVTLFIISIISRDGKFYLLWFAFVFLFFLLFVKKPGTHVYNMFIPLYAFCAFGIKFVLERFRGISLALLFSVSIFLTFQSCLLFVDYSIEYPWEQEKILGIKTKSYSQKNLTNYVLGFPIRKNWLEVSRFLTSLNEKRGENLSYITNEDKSLSSFYMKVPYGRGDRFYAVGVKRPYSFVTDYKFPQIKNKKTIHRVEVNNENVVRIYEVGFENSELNL